MLNYSQVWKGPYLYEKTTPKRLPICYKLILIFGLLAVVSGVTEVVLAIHIARRAVTEKVETHLTDKGSKFKV